MFHPNRLDPAGSDPSKLYQAREVTNRDDSVLPLPLADFSKDHYQTDQIINNKAESTQRNSGL